MLAVWLRRDDLPWYPPGTSLEPPSRLMFPIEATDSPNLALWFSPLRVSHLRNLCWNSPNQLNSSINIYHETQQTEWKLYHWPICHGAQSYSVWVVTCNTHLRPSPYMVQLTNLIWREVHHQFILSTLLTRQPRPDLLKCWMHCNVRAEVEPMNSKRNDQDISAPHSFEVLLGWGHLVIGLKGDSTIYNRSEIYRVTSIIWLRENGSPIPTSSNLSNLHFYLDTQRTLVQSRTCPS